MWTERSNCSWLKHRRSLSSVDCFRDQLAAIDTFIVPLIVAVILEIAKATNSFGNSGEVFADRRSKTIDGDALSDPAMNPIYEVGRSDWVIRFPHF